MLQYRKIEKLQNVQGDKYLHMYSKVYLSQQYKISWAAKMILSKS